MLSNNNQSPHDRPHFSIETGPEGFVIEFYVGVSAVRENVLQELGLAVPDTVCVRGVVDTGAASTSLDRRILESLGIVSVADGPVYRRHAKGTNLANSFYVSLMFRLSTGYLIDESAPVLPADEFSHPGIQAIIGRDMLTDCMITYAG